MNFDKALDERGPPPTGLQIRPLVRGVPSPMGELATAKPEEILSRMLLTKSYISITSTLAELNSPAQDDPAQLQTVKRSARVNAAPSTA